MGRVQQKKIQLWRERIEAAKSFPGSIEAYCEQEGIHSTTFYSWRRRFAAEEAKAISSFVPAVITASSPIRTHADEDHRLPDPKWLGEMLSSLIRSLT